MLAAPFINIFQPYFRDDPAFVRSHLDEAMNALGIAPEPSVGTAALCKMLQCEHESQRLLSGPNVTSTETSFVDSIDFDTLDVSRSMGLITSGPSGIDLAIELKVDGQLTWGGEACSRSFI